MERFECIHGDAMEAGAGIEGYDIVLTDPPYSSGARRDADRQTRGAISRVIADEDWFSHDMMTSWGYSWFMRGLFKEIKAKLPPGSHVYVFSDWRQTPNVYAILESCGFRVNHCLVWDKGHYGMGTYWRNQHENIIFASNGQPSPMLDRGKGSVLRHKNVVPSQRKHR